MSANRVDNEGSSRLDQHGSPASPHSGGDRVGEIPAYEIYALNYAGPAVSPVALLVWLRGWDEKIERYYYIWCVRGGGETIVVDCGVAPALSEERQMANYVSPAVVLGRIGVDAASVSKVLLTHMHWDHASGIELFPNATVYVQEEEFRFWMRDPVAGYPPLKHITDPRGNAYLAGLEGSDRLRLVKGDAPVVPGIDLLLAPGHSPALQVVSVNTAGGTAILGSDCGHLARNYEEHWPSCFIMDMAAWMRSFDKVKQRVSSMELLFPGHDVSMLREYPRVAEGVTRLV